MERRSLIKVIVASIVGLWAMLKSPNAPATSLPTFEPLVKPQGRDEWLMDEMRRLYVEHVEFCAQRGRKPVMSDPDQLFAVVKNLRTLHDLDAMPELYYGWTRELQRCHDTILAAEG